MQTTTASLSAGSCPKGSSWAFLLASLMLHALVVILWTGEPPSGMAGGGVLQVRLEPGVASGADGDRDQELENPLPNAKPEERISPVVAEQVNRTLPKVDVPSMPKARAAAEVPAAVEPKVDSRSASKRREVILGKQSGVRHAQSQPSAESDSAETGSGFKGQPTSIPGTSTAAGERGGMGGDTYRMVQSALRKALLTRFEYPLLARRRGWEGRVRVALLVKPDGGLREMHVVQSSGYQVLDEAALEDLKEVGQLPEANAWLGGKELAVILPIQYRLQ